MSCTFDVNFCEWEQATSDDFNWTRHKGPTPTPNTGPSHDHTTGEGYYIYLQGSKHGQSEVARLVSPVCSSEGPHCFRFWYHMYGVAEAMALRVYVVHNETSTVEWKEAGNKGDIWNLAEVTVHSAGNMQIVLEGMIGEDFRSDVALDDLSIEKGYCTVTVEFMYYQAHSQDIEHRSIHHRTWDHLAKHHNAASTHVITTKTHTELRYSHVPSSASAACGPSTTGPGTTLPNTTTQPPHTTSTPMPGSGTCVVEGDPHYHTFDKQLHHFMGTCTYTLSKLCESNSSLPYFNVEAANEHRGGNTRVSYVRYVDVDVAGQRIRLGKGRVVTVNGVAEVLPCTPSAGVQVSSSGFYTVVTTDFGLRVKFDGNHRVEVTLPSTFGQKVCGMCGNYNGMASDDFLNPDGVLEPDSTSLGNSWQVSNDSSCSAGPLPTPACNETDKQVIASSHFCGLLTDTSGPFQMCHAVLSPSGYFNSCLYDLCELGLDREALCKSLQSYADACQSLGVKIPVWRNATFCPIACPANSHYEPCAAACPATCVDPIAPYSCSLPCVEGCVCDSGYLLYNDRCVPSQQCGCWHNGQHYPVGSEFWTDNTCSSKCTCPARGSKVQCSSASCPAGQYCGVQNGKPECLEHSYGICHVHGDPHYTTFDKVTHNFMGNCTYTLAKVCSNTTSLPHFNIEAKNEHRGNSRVSYVREVLVEVYGERIAMVKNKKSHVLVNSVRQTLPVSAAGGAITVSRSGRYIVLETDFNLRVSYDTDHSVEVKVPTTYFNLTCGMCGNFNNRREDDYMMPNGQQAADSNALGESWQVPDNDSSCGVPVPSPPCSAEEEKLYQSDQFCGMLTASPGSFERCHAVINPQSYFETCFYDLCALNGGQEVLCATLEAYADACQAAGVTLPPWRNATFCPLLCPTNSYYDPCMTGCPATCVDRQAPQNCSKPCMEGCACTSGFLLSGDTCVPEAQCGCLFEGNYYSEGERSVNENCTRQCRCEANGQMVCSALSCREDEVCKIQNGQRDCYPASTQPPHTTTSPAPGTSTGPGTPLPNSTMQPPHTTSTPMPGSGTCVVEGDPHYHTFDKQLHHFMGTCTYTLSKLCESNSSLPYFNVEAANEHRGGNTRVSYVRYVDVDVAGQRIRLGKGRVVTVNGVAEVLPCTPSAGVQVSSSGFYTVVTTDFGLRVKFDGNHRVEVTLPSTFGQKVCGMCGNYNGMASDDFLNPDGVLEPDSTSLGNSWQVSNDSSCSAGPLPTPACNETDKQVIASSHFCGLLTDTSGPFQMCHAVLSPSGYFNSCLYDLCELGLDREALCKSLQSYADACQSLGVKIPVWRNATFCPIACPANSHYEPCAAACPATCVDPMAPATCSLPCVEGCVCDSGYLLYNDRCVPSQQCGCWHNGQHYPVGSEFWTDNTCSSKCTCPARGSKVQCSSASCPAGQYCGVQNGKPECLEHSYGICHVHGDPHYTTFDKVTHNFMGNCTYTLAKVCSNTTSLPHFNIEAKNEHRGNSRVSYVREVLVEVYGERIAMVKNKKSHVLVNSVRQTLPVSAAGGAITVSRSGRYIVLETDFNLRVSYDTDHSVEVKVPTTYFNLTCGMCGNFNNRREDDYMMPNGQQAADSNALGESWQVPDNDSSCGVPVPSPPCSAEEEKLYQSDQFCGMLTASPGSFERCHAVINPQSYFETCFYDLCALNGGQEVLCATLEAYADACQAAGVTLPPWRNATFCPLLCPTNSYYDPCMTGCPATCVDRQAPQNCSKPCMEGCACTSGFLLSGDTCVPEAQCGCLFEGNYYSEGERSVNENCTRQCRCEANGQMVCSALSCREDEVCKIQNGQRDCYPASTQPPHTTTSPAPGTSTGPSTTGPGTTLPNTTTQPPHTTSTPMPGSGTCVVEGDPHYHTFDKQLHHFMGTCTYTLSKLCESNSSLPYFNVEAANEHRGGNTRVSYVRYVDVDVAGQRIRLGKGRVVTVNGVAEVLPCTPSAGVQVSSSGFYTVVTTDFGLRVKFDGNHRVEVTLPSTFGQKVCGMCGNYNGMASDDFLNPDGVLEPDSTSLGNSWQVSNDSSCSAGPLPTPACNETDKQVIASSHFCGLLTDTSGPFQMCHAVLSPSGYFNSCLYDLCELGLDREALCKSLQSYADACQSLGVKIPVWRNATFCPIACPANSHYEPCAAACPATCVDPIAPYSCSLPCVEGCVCDSGYLLYNDRCVPSQQCGCWHNGQHYPVGSEFWTDNTCSSKCTCPARGSKVQCSSASCPAGQYCGVQNGKPECLEHSYGICHVHGDPHYTTFDKVTHNFMGNCTYTLAKVCSNTTSLPHFNIEAKNEHRGNSRVSYVREVLVEVYGERIAMVKNKKSHVLVNSVRQTLPVSAAGGAITVSRSGRYIVLETDFNLRVSYDTDHSVEVKVPTTYFNLTCGMCGNFNNRREDDYMMPNGQQAADSNALGESWQVPDNDSSCGVPVPSPPCSAEEEKLYQSDQFCGMLTASPGSFERCHAVINPQSYFETCFYDLCALNGGQEVLCATLEAYADACQAAGVTLPPWRNATFCPLLCPTNSYYDPCMTGCPATCVDRQAPQNCSKPCMEGCACTSGFLLSGDTCVPEAQCGCLFEGNYYSEGERSVNENCTRQCRCEANGQMVCSALSCREDEVCKIQNGQRDCYPASTQPPHTTTSPAPGTSTGPGTPLPNSTMQPPHTTSTPMPGSGTCVVEGDPHYHTFDKQLHHFMGTCTYTLSKLCESNSSLPYFNVEAANEHRGGNTRVSYVRYVDVDVAGQRIRLGKGRVVTVNGVAEVLPCTPSAGVQVSSSGFYTVVTTDFGLRVKFDGNHRVEVTLPSTFGQKVCGMCGNYNGMASDDFLNPDGVLEPDSTSLGNSWQVSNDSSCSAGPLPTPACNETDKQVIASSHFCGLLTDTSGPFQMCHAVLSPSGYFNSCLYDLCELGLDREALCKSLQSYADACQSLGVKIPVWRNATFCPIACPANSHYEPCAAACPATCVDPMAPATCSLPCVEGCVCDSGYLLYNDRCVPSQQCGCWHNGQHYPVGSEFWTDNTCSSKCTCPARGSKVQCSSASCPAGQYCGVQNGKPECLEHSYGICHVHGDPHYTTFDKVTHNFMGNCTYTLAKVCSNTTSLPYFNIEAKNEHRGNSRVSYVREVLVEVYGERIAMVKNKKSHVLVNSVRQTLPVSAAGGAITVSRSGRYIVLETDFNLRVSYDTDHSVEVKVPTTYFNLTCGMCGNFNNRREDDYMMPNGQQAADSNALGESWQVPDNDSSCGVPVPSPPCSAEEEKLYQSDQFCGMLTASPGSFERCHAVINPQSYFETCFYDLCALNGGQEVLCATLEAYADACQAAGVTLPPWRNATFCPLLCPTNSYYDPCMTGCPATCVDRQAPQNCSKPCMEGCACTSGFLLSGDTCVPEAQCGCLFEGNYYSEGERSVNENCTRQCRCEANGQMVCSALSCREDEVCKIQNGQRDCYPASTQPPHTTTSPAPGTSTVTVEFMYYQAHSQDIEHRSIHHRTWDPLAKHHNAASTHVITTKTHTELSSYNLSPLARHLNAASKYYNITSTWGKHRYCCLPSMFFLAVLGTQLVYFHLVGHPRLAMSMPAPPPDCNFACTFDDDFCEWVQADYSSIDWIRNKGPTPTQNTGPSSDHTTGDGYYIYLQGTNALPGFTAHLVSPVCSSEGPHCFRFWYHMYGVAETMALRVYVTKGEDLVLLWSSTGNHGDIWNLGEITVQSTGNMQIVLEGEWGEDVRSDVALDDLSIEKGYCTVTIEFMYYQTHSQDIEHRSIHHRTWDHLAKHHNAASTHVITTKTHTELRSIHHRTWDHLAKHHNAASTHVITTKTHTELRYSHVPSSASAACGPSTTGPGTTLPNTTTQPPHTTSTPMPGSGTCVVEGDPHYHTFDKQLHHFMGTCTYTLSKLCESNSSLPYFNVEAANEHRGGNTRVSYVRYVDVDVAGQRIRLGKGRVVTVNGVAEVLPCTPSAGVQVSSSGFYTVVTTDFGLRVKFDGNHRVEVTLPSTFGQKVCGMCGNYNGMASDDFLNPDGVLEPDSTSLGNSWQVSNDSSCSAGPLPTPACNETDKQVIASSHFCGLLTDTSGPFQMCHAVLSPSGYFNSCLYDLCELGLDREALCKSLQSYADACQSLGVKIPVWRNATFCPIACPANSHYEPCAAACPATCVDPIAPYSCSLPCVEGCVCDSGYLLYNDRCVPSQQCGCWHNGQHYPVGSEFWTDNTCSSKCTCPARGSKVQCSSASCPAGQYCGVQNGKPECLEHSYGICHVHGDPHYTTFDKVTHNFMGDCTYTLAKVCSNTTSLPYFNIEAKNEHRGNSRVSYVREVLVEVYGERIAMVKNKKSHVLVNSVRQTLPVSAAGGAITVSRSGRYIVLETDFNLRVSYDTDHSVEVKVPTTYFNLTCGMCGNFNNRREDDYMMPNGQQAADSNALGESWQVPDNDSSCGVPVPSPPCSAEEEKLYQSDQFCGMLTASPGSFERCHAVINPQSYFETCFYDLCALNGGQEVLCAALEAYADACQAAGVTLPPWRNATFCPLLCPTNSYYDPCMTGCPATCVDRQAPQNCSKPCMEGCACTSGFLLSGDTCVPEAQCGCLFEGNYYSEGERSVNENCTRQCRCEANGQMVCSALSCREDEVCKIQNGQRDCYPASTQPPHTTTSPAPGTSTGPGTPLPNSTMQPPHTTSTPMPGSGTCVVEGDPHYHTFDKQLHHFMGTCTYTLSKLCESNSSLPYFNVEAANEHRGGNTRVSYVRYVDVDVAGQRIRLGKGRVVTVNGVAEVLPCTPSAGVQVSSSGFYTVVTTDFGLRVKFDGNHRVEVTLPSTFGQKVCGMCGNYNGMASDDFLNPDGVLEPDSTSLGNSWQVSNDSSCSAGPLPTPACNETDKQVITSSHFCGLLTDTSGPFQMCHAVLSPSGYFNSCLYDLCELGLDREALCKSLQSYADACQSLGVKIPVWRNATFCPIACPANSHYEPCAAACPATCVDPMAPATCSLPCVEGCVCDSGYLLYNDRCVPSQQCGCWHNGQHYPVGSEFWTDNTCSSKCTCPARGSKVQCSSASCPAGQYCGVQNGKPECLEHSYGICHVHSDPHYNTFDKVTHSFMGDCTYTLAKVCSNTTSLPYFNIEAKNEHRGNSRVSYVREVLVEVYGERIAMVKNKKSHVLVNSVRQTLPVSAAGGAITVSRSGRYIVLETDFNLRVSYDTDHSVEVKVPTTYFNLTCGMCGNFNNRREDDYMMPNGQQAADSNALGESWQVPDNDSSCGVPVPSPPCSAEEEKLYQSDQFCGMLTASPGSFERCHAVINPQSYFETCFYDLCALNGGQEVLCAALEAYADACQAAGVTLPPWRNATFCPLLCPTNSYYDPCMTGCPATCVDRQAPQNCSKPCMEGCACTSGFLLSGDTCVPEAQCGCLFEGNYYSEGERSVNENCTRQCRCEANGQMVCSALSCREDEVCKIQNGQRDCYPASTQPPHTTTSPAPGTSTALALPAVTIEFMYYQAHSQDIEHRSIDTKNHNHFTRHYNAASTHAVTTETHTKLRSINIKTHDTISRLYNAASTHVITTRTHTKLRVHNFMGNCTYTLSKVCNISERLPYFDVSTTNEHRGANTKVSYVNGSRMNLPVFIEKKISIQSSGGYVLLETDFGLWVRYDGNHYAEVSVPSDYSGLLCGLCGNYNDDPHDDNIKPNGDIASGSTDLGQSWLVPENNTICSSGTEEQCDPVLESEAKKNTACGIITDPTGIFKDCHTKVPPQNFFENCVYDMCFTGGQATSLCYGLQAYAESCINAGICIEWRNSTLCREATCQVAGDPHYFTFDGMMYTFVGTCTYTLVEVVNTSSVIPITILGKNEDRGLRGATYLKEVYIDVYGVRITLQKSQGILLNNERVYTPVENRLRGVSIGNVGRFIVVETDFGAIVKYDGNHHLEITLPQSYFSKVHGMCGNFNDKREDDLSLPNGVLVSVPEFGNSWKVVEDSDAGCLSDQREDDVPPCTAENKPVIESQCNVLKSDKFKACHNLVKPEDFIQICIYDMCQYDGMKSTLCDIVQVYVDTCRNHGITIKWRTSTFCRFGTCQIMGDPHYRTFDGLVHHFQGKYTYILAQTIPDLPDTLTPFSIEGMNYPLRRSRHITYLKEILVNVYSHTVRFRQNKELVLDGVRVRPPARPHEGIRIYQRSTRIYLETDFGLYLSFDGNQNADIKLATTYSDRVEGLCGDFDGRHRNDFTKPDGVWVKNVNVFGESWKVPLKRTASRLRSCLFDMCMEEDQDATLCRSLEEYVLACQQKGVSMEGWRQQTVCGGPCMPNPCKNDGVCSETTTNTSPYFSCACSELYRGPSCEDEVKDPPVTKPEDHTVAIIVGVVAGVVVIVILVTSAVYVYR
ncbi:IgGFc-binding protein-like [Phoenicopterus ruber ruber]